MLILKQKEDAVVVCRDGQDCMVKLLHERKTGLLFWGRTVCEWWIAGLGVKG